MTAVQLNALNAQIWRDMGTIADNEAVMRRVAKYLRRVVKEMNNDPTRVTKDEFLASIERGEKEYLQGKTHSINSVDELHKFLDSL